jgi:alpha-beta hydrolase superfamily lysophospholipase
MNASAKAQDYVSKNTKISIPIQFIVADNDTVAVNSTTEKMFDKLKSNNPKNILQKFNGKHDLLRCLVREEVFESILRFIESVKN